MTSLTPGEGEKDAVYRSIRPTWVTATWVALLLVLVAFAASQARLPQAPPTGMVAAFVDLNGNDIDDSCEDPATVEAETDPDAQQAAEEAIDLDGDGTISVSEAAQSDRIGGKNCNHGGYVSWVAHGSCPDPVTEPVTAPVTGPALDAAAATCEDATTTSDEASAAKDAEKAEKKAARDAAKAERKAAHDAAKAAKDAAKAAAKAERDAAKAEKKAARDAAKATKAEGKGKSKNH